ncbi:MAG: hypothetical protein Q7T86_05955 [Hyphomicrobiaceae bacterium]|jgi:hypothetical protein|nr:hypothetical protein [Hyphomicrobiaceae bacterium]
MLAPYLGEYSFLEPVIIASLVVFVVDLIGNIVSFSNRFVNALVTAIIFGLIFGALSYYGYGGVAMDLPTSVPASSP